MDASDILRLLTTKHYSPADLDDVNILCREFPEFSTAHMLKVRVLEALGREKKKQLKIAAVYSTDRKKLFQLVTDVMKQEEPEPETAEEDNGIIMFSEESDQYADIIIEQHAPYAGQGKDTDLLEWDEEPEEDLLEIDESVDESVEGPVEMPAEMPVKENNKNHLIISFITGEPGPIRADQPTSLKGDVSLDSIREHDGFITDTLARIYIKQGLLAKAIYAYEKLSLKYPEKSAYFAAQIEKIRNINH